MKKRSRKPPKTVRRLKASTRKTSRRRAVSVRKVTGPARAEAGAVGAPEVAFYYPGHIWSRPDWIKTLLLFFDGVGLLVPEYKQHEPEIIDPVLAGPLRDKGLLHYLIADKVVNKDATQRLAAAIEQLMSSGAFENLTTETDFHELSMSRMGFFGSREIAEALFEKFKAKGLATKSKDGVSIPLHPAVRYSILVLLAQILRPQGAQLGLDLSPATDRPDIVQALSDLLNVPATPSAGHVIAFDLQSVSVDLGAIPLDEVLAFRTENARAHRQYVTSVRRFARELSLMPEADREKPFLERQAELDDLANDLKRTARKVWKRPASFGLTLAGAAWTYHTGDPLGAILTGLGALLGVEAGPANEAGAFSYLFAAHRRYA